MTAHGDKRTKEQKKAYSAAYYQAHKNKWNQERTPEQSRWYRYGLTREQYDVMMSEQEGRCAICRKEFIGPPHVDHDHRTKAVRGLLCKTCNLAVGYLHDDPDLAVQAAIYLKHCH